MVRGCGRGEGSPGPLQTRLDHGPQFGVSDDVEVIGSDAIVDKASTLDRFHPAHGGHRAVIEQPSALSLVHAAQAGLDVAPHRSRAQDGGSDRSSVRGQFGCQDFGEADGTELRGDVRAPVPAWR